MLFADQLVSSRLARFGPDSLQLADALEARAARRQEAAAVPGVTEGHRARAGHPSRAPGGAACGSGRRALAPAARRSGSRDASPRRMTSIESRWRWPRPRLAPTTSWSRATGGTLRRFSACSATRLPPAAMALRAIERCEAVLPPDHLEIAWQYNDLGLTLQVLGDYHGARQAYRRAHAAVKSRFGTAHLHVATTAHNLGLLESAIGDLEEAERLQRRAVAIWEAYLGARHPYVGRGLAALADVLGSAGRPAEARTVWAAALDLRLRALGPRHPDTALTLAALAQFEESAGRVEEAARLATRGARGLVERRATSSIRIYPTRWPCSAGLRRARDAPATPRRFLNRRWPINASDWATTIPRRSRFSSISRAFLRAATSSTARSIWQQRGSRLAALSRVRSAQAAPGHRRASLSSSRDQQHGDLPDALALLGRLAERQGRSGEAVRRCSNRRLPTSADVWATNIPRQSRFSSTSHAPLRAGTSSTGQSLWRQPVKPPREAMCASASGTCPSGWRCFTPRVAPKG